MDNNMYSLRILSKGKITDLSKGFDLGGIPFHICTQKGGINGCRSGCKVPACLR